jgi:hypothetical protein
MTSAFVHRILMVAALLVIFGQLPCGYKFWGTVSITPRPISLVRRQYAA